MKKVRMMSAALLAIGMTSAALSAQAQTLMANGYNDSGQLGDDTTSNKYAAVPVKGVGGIGTLSRVTSIARGSRHTLALADGTVYAWGNNDYGQLGVGDTTLRRTPIQVGTPQNPLLDVVAVAAGEVHSVALKSDGTVWAWGNNDYGCLGDGTGTQHLLPVQVKLNGQTALTGIVAIAGGYNYTLALRSDGTVWAWGGNYSGCLGTGEGNTSYPVQVLGDGLNGKFVGAVAIGSGGTTSVILRKDGIAFAFGYNGYGQLGIGTDANRDQPVPILNESGSDVMRNVISVVAGDNHVVLARADGKVFATGYNGYGELGDNTTATHYLPVPVKGVGGTSTLSGIVSVAAGNYYSVALKSDGTVYGWGRNHVGQLGDTADTNRTTPVQMKVLSPAGNLTGIIALAPQGGYSNHTVTMKAVKTIQFRVTLDNQLQLGTSVDFEFRPTDGTETFTLPANAEPGGLYTFFDMEAKTYNVAIKKNKWLTKVIPNVRITSSTNVIGLQANLKGGDANGDNRVDILDLLAVISSYNKTSGQAGYNPNADINDDNAIDVLDLSLVVSSYNSQGDQ